MRAIAIEEFGGTDKLQMKELPRPRPARGELLIRVVAAGVNPVDVRIREGCLPASLPHAFPLIPGWDAAGVVEELGEGSTRFRRGDRVWTYALKATVQWGCYAQYVSVAESSVGLMPTTTFEQAAGTPLAALAAAQALHARGGIEPRQTVLIHAAAGGVGHCAVQLARHAGAQVWGTAGADSAEFVCDLGASQVLDYANEPFEQALLREHPDGVDLVLDLVGGDVLSRSYDVVRRGGRLVSLVEQPAPSRVAERGIVAHHLVAQPDREQLGTLARMIDREQLRTHVQCVFPLAEAAAAQRTIAEGHVRGKLVLRV